MPTPSTHPPTLTPHETRRVAVEAGCDPRTVQKYLDGEQVVSTVHDRIRRALDELGYRDARRRVTP